MVKVRRVYKLDNIESRYEKDRPGVENTRDVRPKLGQSVGV